MIMLISSKIFFWLCQRTIILQQLAARYIATMSLYDNVFGSNTCISLGLGYIVAAVVVVVIIIIIKANLKGPNKDSLTVECGFSKMEFLS